MIPHEKIAKRIQHHIDMDPWRITVYNPGREQGIDEETVQRFTGRVYPAGTQGRAYRRDAAVALGVESIGDYVWVLLVPQGESTPMTNSTLVAVHQATRERKEFQVLFSMWLPSHQQVLLQEMQP
jgi:hypothetical protein